MTTEEIKEAADMAEKWPGATVLNFGEVPFKALVAWVASHSHQGELLTMDFDVESVKGMFEDWWRKANTSADGSAVARTVQPVVVCSDAIHCGDCPHLKPYGDENDLTAKCDLTGNDLMWYDYWIAECDTHNMI